MSTSSSSVHRHRRSPSAADPGDAESAALPLSRLLGETRSRIIDLLRTAPRSIGDLASELDLSEEAVRRHLRVLEREALLDSEVHRDGGRGRPRTEYRLSDRAHRLYPDRTADLANELWEYLESQHGRRAVLGFLRWRQQQQRERYAEHIDDTADVAERVHRLAELLSDDGFLAESAPVESVGGRQLVQLTQSHCAVRDVAAEHPEVCAYEAALFKDLLGTKVSRRETIATGSSSCVCTIEASPGQAAARGDDS